MIEDVGGELFSRRNATCYLYMQVCRVHLVLLCIVKSTPIAFTYVLSCLRQCRHWIEPYYDKDIRWDSSATEQSASLDPTPKEQAVNGDPLSGIHSGMQLARPLPIDWI